LKITDYTQPINIIDIGCGSGIFSIIALLSGVKVNELVLTDVEDNCLFASLQNFLFNKKYFDIKTLTVIKSDLLDSVSQSYNFDIVLANMPQTPSRIPIRRIQILTIDDKFGGENGIQLYERLFKSIDKFINPSSHIYIL
jgi:methylase of polypeptide subunit release factors